jgi:hypothetical protein
MPRNILIYNSKIDKLVIRIDILPRTALGEAIRCVKNIPIKIGRSIIAASARVFFKINRKLDSRHKTN